MIMFSRKAIDKGVDNFEPSDMVGFSTKNGDWQSKLAKQTCWYEILVMGIWSVWGRYSIETQSDKMVTYADIVVIVDRMNTEYMNGAMMSIFYGLQWHTILYHCIMWYTVDINRLPWFIAWTETFESKWTKWAPRRTVNLPVEPSGND